jgi:hypothetical protein
MMKFTPYILVGLQVPGITVILKSHVASSLVIKYVANVPPLPSGQKRSEIMNRFKMLIFLPYKN